MRSFHERTDERMHERTYTTLQWLGCAGFRLRAGGSSILIDPFVSRNEHARPRQMITPADLRGDSPIFLSHGHFDHARDLGEIAGDSDAVIYGSATALASALRAGVPPQRLQPVDDRQVIALDDMQAVAFHSRHIRFDLPLFINTLRRAGMDIAQAVNLGLRYPCGEVMSWRFTIGEISLHYFGSVGASVEELARLAEHPLDVLLLPLQGHSRIIERAATFVETLRPRLVIPHHFDDFFPPLSCYLDPAPFVRAVRERLPGCHVLAPAMNRTLVLERELGYL